MYVLSKYIKKIKTFLVKFSNFTVEKNLCILHGRVFVMFLSGINLSSWSSRQLLDNLVMFCPNVGKKSQEKKKSRKKSQIWVRIKVTGKKSHR